MESQENKKPKSSAYILGEHIIRFNKQVDSSHTIINLSVMKSKVIEEAMEEYKQISLVHFTDWLKWALFHNPDEDDSQTLVNEYLKHNS